MKKEIKRGYVRWTDENGVYHKEPLYEHADLLSAASPEEQLAAEELRRLNEEGERRMREMETDAEEEIVESLERLKAAPPEVMTAASLEDSSAPASGAEEPAQGEELRPQPSYNDHTTPEEGPVDDGRVNQEG